MCTLFSFQDMRNKYSYVTLGILLSVSVATSLLQPVAPAITVYAGEDSSSETDIAQDVKQKQKCKVGNFGDPEDSASSTTFGFCNQQGQNNFAGGGSLGSVGINVGP